MPISEPPDDPVFLHARREAIVILLVWAACFAWTVPYCYLNGYGAPTDGEPIPLVIGMPAWVFWGVAVPWLVGGLVSIGLCLFYIEDDDLAEERSGEEPEGRE
ncbi:MAG: DUF997 family protein [Planctomycetaceae bacterium]